MTKNQHVDSDSSQINLFIKEILLFECDFLKAGMSKIYCPGLLEVLASSCDWDSYRDSLYELPFDTTPFAFSLSGGSN